MFQFLWSPDASRAILVTRNTGRTRYRSHLVEVASLSVTHLPALDLDMSFAVPVGLDTPLWSWSPDGQYVAAYRGEGLLRLHLASGEQQSLAGVQAFDAIVGFAWLPDSSAIALFGVPAITAGIAANSATTVSIDTAGDAGLYQGYLWPVGANRLVATGVSTTTLPPLLWSPDRRHILEYTASHTRILSVTDGRVVLDIPHRRIMSSGNLWSPDGRYLVLSSAHVDKTLRIIDVQQGRIMEQPAGGGTLEWSPTGDFFTMYNPVQRQLEITPLNDAGVGRGWRLPVEGQARLCYPAVAR
ncbi:MAG: hypothetical protein MUE40_14430 [Anaerolineae bacterium]|nr:hypothetical protein [Anaerolineae bacterium]